MKLRNRILACLAIAGGILLPAAAGPLLPGSRVMIKPSAASEGAMGLRISWSADNGRTWHEIGDGYAFVNSDFGPWGSHKKMFGPVLRRLPDGCWAASWKATPTGSVYAYAESDDLRHWSPQRYSSSPFFNTVPADSAVITDYGFVRGLEEFCAGRRMKAQQNAETMAQDPVRFAGLKPLTASIKLDPANSKAISDKLIGIFFEDINYAADGGLYAELVQNRDFEYRPGEGHAKGWGPGFAWTYAIGGREAELPLSADSPVHPNNSRYAALRTPAETATLTNGGFDGIAVKKGEKYDFSAFARLPQGAGSVTARVELLDKSGNAIATKNIKFGSHKWKRSEVVLTPSQSEGNATLRITFPAGTEVDLDMISLFPQRTFHGRKNGLRADLAQTLADLKPRFVRFPGGCVAHGNGIDNMYDWKGSIGPLEARKPLSNLWGYHQTRGLGYHEYFEFCEDLGAEPLPVVAAGVPCQNSGWKSSHTHDDLTHFGQQCGIPMDSLDSYIQDILDLIEYANGDAKTTKWGKKRAENGHPAPFNLKYIGIGNEDMITEVFAERFPVIYKAVKERYPDINVVGTSGPFYEGTDYEYGWALADSLGVELVDEHYYVEPGWMVNNQHFYDNYDRKGPKVYLGEYAAHLPGRPSNVETALSEALYLTSVERNGDVVEMTSYAPLLAKDGHTQWRPDLIYFSNTEVRPTVDYYVQQLYGNNSGDRYIPSEVTLTETGKPVTNADVSKRFAVSSVTDSATGDLIVKLANLLPVEVSTAIDMPDGEKSAASAPSEVTVTTLAGAPDDDKARPVTTRMAIGSPLTLKPYSFTVLRIPAIRL